MNSVNGVLSSCCISYDSVDAERPWGSYTFLTPSLTSHIDVSLVIPGSRSPIVKGNDTPVELSTVEVMDLR